MKIKINQNETYTIDLPEEITAQNFSEMLYRLNNINKILGKDVFSMMNNVVNSNKDGIKKVYNVIKKSKPRDPNAWFRNRDNVLKAIRLVYHGTKEDKYKFAKENNEEWDGICKRLWGLRKRYNVQPGEVGIKRFPTKFELSSTVEQLKL